MIVFILCILYSCKNEEYIVSDSNVKPKDPKWISYQCQSILSLLSYGSVNEIVWLSDSRRFVFAWYYYQNNDIKLFDINSSSLTSIGGSALQAKNLILSPDENGLFYLSLFPYSYDSTGIIKKYNFATNTTINLSSDTVKSFKIMRAGSGIVYLESTKVNYNDFYRLILTDSSCKNETIILEDNKIPEFALDNNTNEVFVHINSYNTYYKYSVDTKQLNKITLAAGYKYFAPIKTKTTLTINNAGKDSDGLSTWNLSIKDSNAKEIFATRLLDYNNYYQCNYSSVFFYNERRALINIMYENYHYGQCNLCLLDLDKKKIAYVTPSTNYNISSYGISPDKKKIVIRGDDNQLNLIDWTSTFK